MSKLSCRLGPHDVVELGPEEYSGTGVHVTVRSPMAPPTWELRTEHFRVEWAADGDVYVECSGIQLAADDLFGNRGDWTSDEVAAKTREQLILLRDELNFLIDGERKADCPTLEGVGT
jgi:hypothetical protein